MKLKITLEYQGDNFSGWQFQEGVRTVQGEIESALSVLFASEAKKRGMATESPVKIPVQGSGRTDAGVHARGQVASFSVSDEFQIAPGRIFAALNGLTPHDIVIRSLETVEEGFDARFTPHQKLYCYRYLLRDAGAGLYAGRVWNIGSRELLIRTMIETARLFAGKHDFSAFRAQDCTAKTTERTIVSSELVRESDEVLMLQMVGKGFLKQMVRIIAGTLVDVGRGHIAASLVEQLIKGGSRVEAGQTAPACGLTLEWVRYDALREP